MLIHQVKERLSAARWLWPRWRLPLLAGSDEVGGGVEGVGAWWAAQPGWWMELWDSVGHLDSPGGVVEESVVSAAERDAVFPGWWGRG